MRTVAALLAFAASALAYAVTEPAPSTGWTTTGPNVVAWNMVSTDPANFTIVLSNQKVSPPTQQVLAALVVGTLGQTTVNPPSGGWKTGQGFRVNLVQDSQHLDSILAQSEEFDITVSSSTSTFMTATGTNAGTGVMTVPPAPTTAGTTGTADALNPSTTEPSNQDNGASPSTGIQAGFFAGLALLGAFLA